MKRTKKIIIALLVISLVGSLLTGCGGKSDNMDKVEEAIEQGEFSEAEKLTSQGEGKTKEINKALRVYQSVVNDIQMQYVHVQLDKNNPSELAVAYEKIKDIPKAYKEYSDLKKAVNIYKSNLEKAVDLEKELRKEYPKMRKFYEGSKPDKYTALATKWKEKIDKEFPVENEASEDDIEAELKWQLNDIFLNSISLYMKQGFDPDKSSNKESPFENAQEEQKQWEEENTESFGEERDEPEEYTEIELD